jgi:ADP-dependent NAD(P)H-hydrate dehydratase / NAD(P)H-hydrate epimerase
MIRIATHREMRECDQRAIAEFGIPGLILMENAGRSVSRLIQNSFSPLDEKSVRIYCGKGNNGGDGFVVARHLYNLGMNVQVILCSHDEISGDAGVNLELVRTIAEAEGKNPRIVVEEFPPSKRLTGPDIVIDALFGTGFAGNAEGEYAAAIDHMNSLNVPVVAIDICSGLNGETGIAGTPTVRASHTVTMGMPKTGHCINDGPDVSGDLVVAEISIPRIVFETSNITTYLVEHEDILQRLPRRSRRAHKNSVGKIFILAGSRGLTGAAKMASISALRTGAGSVVVGVPEGVYQSMAKHTVEVMPLALPQTASWTISTKAMPEIKKRIAWADRIIIGPGLGRDPETDSMILDVIATSKKPMLIDADGLNALATDIKVLMKRKADTILTPHIGEFSRISGIDAADIPLHLIDIVREFATTYKVTLVCKGAPTVIASDTGEVFINSTGNPGMATAGAGDVLTGAIGGLWGQMPSAIDAAVCGVFLHGFAGDLAVEEKGVGLIATDIQKRLPQAIQFMKIKE